MLNSISIKGYLTDIGELQYVHFPFKNNQDITGNLLIHLIFLLQLVQKLDG